MIPIQQISSAAYGAQTYKPAVKSADREPTPLKSPTVPGEQVELSDASVNLKKLRDIVDATPDVRIKVVEEIKLKIQHVQGSRKADSRQSGLTAPLRAATTLKERSPRPVGR